MLVKLIRSKKEKKYKIGYFPHFVDYNRVKDLFPNDLVVNLYTDSPMEILDKISSCELIISSSLHGIICSHAYDIPTVWAKSITPIKGDNIKFYDYFQSVNLNIDEPADYFSKECFVSTHCIEHIDQIFKKLKKDMMQ
jgi:exopolysaccharide biosynthesis predicted pyruvyltransferase EpsI